MVDLKKADAKKEFQKMWVAGTLGVYFTTLLRTLPVHLHQISSTPDWVYTFDLFIRYGYLIWFLVYFFMSNLRIDPANLNELSFDVIQSFVSLTAVVFLDFVVPGTGIPLREYWWAVTIANLTIIIIASLALFWFHDERLTPIRIAGIVLALLSIVVAWLPISALVALSLVGVSVIVLLIVLATFVSEIVGRMK